MATLAEKFSGDASNARLNQSRILLTQGSHASQVLQQYYWLHMEIVYPNPVTQKRCKFS